MCVCVCVLAGSNCGDTAPHCLHDCMRGLSIDRSCSRFFFVMKGSTSIMKEIVKRPGSTDQ